MIDELKNGIENRDWSLVESFYFRMTGNKITIEEEPTVKKKAVKKTAKKKSQSAKTEENKRINLFESMDIKIDREPGFEKVNDKVARSPRNRKPFKLVPMTCMNCGKQEQVAPLFVKDLYRCDRCIRKQR